MFGGRLIIAAILVVTLLMTDTAYADPTPPLDTLTLTGPASVRVGTLAVLTAKLTDQAAQPVTGESITFERLASNGLWESLASVISDGSGLASYSITISATSTTFRATDGDLHSTPLTVTGYRLSTTLSLSGTWHLTDGHVRTLRLRWRAADRSAVPGVVRVYRRAGKAGTWRLHSTHRLNAAGQARFTVRPRSDTRWKAVGLADDWWLAAATTVHFLDNRPPGIPVAYPAAAPRPTRLPPQAHAVGKGANPVVTRISARFWRSMVGRSWHLGCPVGRAELRLVRINYWDFNGYRRRGALVVRDRIAWKAAGALSGMYRGRFPIRAMYPVDRFGWSAYLHGADDYASMEADNSSGFNCRWVTGSPGVQSPHSYGTAIDLNTWENPFHSARGIVPDRWWAPRSDPRIAWRTRGHPVVRIWLRHGFHWTYGTSDSQHMDGRLMPTEGSFVAD